VKLFSLILELYRTNFMFPNVTTVYDLCIVWPMVAESYIGYRFKLARLKTLLSKTCTPPVSWAVTKYESSLYRVNLVTRGQHRNHSTRGKYYQFTNIRIRIVYGTCRHINTKLIFYLAVSYFFQVKHCPHASFSSTINS